MLSPELYIETTEDNTFDSSYEGILETHSILKNYDSSYAIISTTDGEDKYDMNLNAIQIKHKGYCLLVVMTIINEDQESQRIISIKNPKSITFGIPSENASQQYQQAVYEFDDEQCKYICTEYTITDFTQE